MGRFVKAATQPAVVLLLVSVAFHGLLPFTDYLCWDDWWLANWLAHQRFDYLARFYSESGSPLGLLYFAALSCLPHLLLSCKLLGVIVPAASGIVVHAIGRRSGFLSSVEALLLGVVVIALPAHKFNGGVIYSAYTVPPFLFLLATLAMVCGDQSSGRRHVLLRLLALLLFWISFVVPSLLMFYGGVFVLLVLIEQRRRSLSWFHIPWAYCLHRADLVLLPFVFWIIKTLFTPTHGFYANYNQIHPSLDAVSLWCKTLPTVLLDPFTFVWAEFGRRRFALPALLLLGGLAAVLCRRSAAWGVSEEEGSPPSLWKPLGLFAFGALILVFGTAPYVLVRKGFGPYGIPSSYTPLIPLPVGVLLVAVRSAARPGAGNWRGVALTAAFGVSLAAWGTSWWHNYLSQQLLQIRNESIFQHIHNSERASACTIYALDVRCPVNRTFDRLDTWSWCYSESGLYREPRSYALLPRPDGRPFTQAQLRKSLQDTSFDYALGSIDLHGRQGSLTVYPGPGFRGVSTAMRYLVLKCVRPSRVDEFVRQVTIVQFTPLPSSTEEPPNGARVALP